MSVAQIASVAGVTAPSVYRHFSDKQAILGEAVLDAIHRLEEITTPELTFAEFAVEMTSATVGRPDLAVLWRWGVLHLGPQWRDAIRARSKALLDRWTTGVRRLRPELHPDQARLLAQAIVSAASSAILRPGKLSAAKHMSTLADVLGRVGAASLPAQRPEEAARLPARNRVPAEGRREQLLAAAAWLFLDRGFAAVGVDELGSAVGISGPSVYRHFPDKQAVLAAVCLRGARRLSDRVEAELSQIGDDSPSARLHALVRAHVSVLLGSPDLVVALGIGTVELVGAAGQEVRSSLRTHLARWTAALMQLDESLSLPEARVIAYAALTLANDIARTRSARARPHLEAELSALLSSAVGVAAEPGKAGLRPSPTSGKDTAELAG